MPLGSAKTLATKSRRNIAKRRTARGRAVRRPESIDDYLAGISPDKRAALEKLRRSIRTAAPRAEECISYGIPAFRLDGKVIGWFAAAAGHCSFFPGGAVQDFAKELAAYDTSKGTVRFPPKRPLPAGLVRKLVRARIARNAVPRKPRRGPAVRRRR
ncbi:MAG TPA: DUF1801 domain-containing protein [Thermoanaerobaculia bacterium]|jgi:uncharacterized protein YdhG (YjbR/CyaY superfamily)